MADVAGMVFEVKDKLEEAYESFIDSGEDKAQRMLAVVLAVKRLNDTLDFVWAANGLFSPSKESESTSAPEQTEPEAKTTRFSEGDLVEVVKESEEYSICESFVGKNGKVISVHDDGEAYKVRLSGTVFGCMNWYFPDECLAPYTEPKTKAPQFKEGDAVRIIDYCDEMYLPPEIVGAEGTVEEANRPNGNILVSVAKGYGNGMTWVVPHKCLELLPKPTTLEINGQPYTVPEGYRVCGDDELWQEGMVYSHDVKGEPWDDTYRPTVSKEVCSKRDVATIKSKYMSRGGVILAPVTSKPVVK